MENENKIEGKQDTPSLGENQTVAEDREVVKTPVNQDTVPYARFKEVIDDKNEMKNDLRALKGEMESLKQQQPEEEEPLDWKEAQARAVNKAVSKIEARTKKVADDKYQQDQRIEVAFKNLKSIGQDITSDIKKAVLTKMIKTGSNDVFGTYLSIKEQLDTTAKTDQLKKDGFVPPSQKGSDAGKPILPYKELRDTPLETIVDRLAKKAK